MLIFEKGLLADLELSVWARVDGSMLLPEYQCTDMDYHVGL